MQKRVGQTCAQVWRLQSAVLCAGAPAAIVLEDDVVLRPNRTAFRVLLPRLLRALHARQAGGRSWDVAFLGSCFERLRAVPSCEELSGARDGAACADAAADSPYRLWLSSAVQPLCMHGLVLTPRAAHALRASMREWLARYHAAVVRYYANSTSEPGAATCEGTRWIKGMAFAINGHDVPLRKAIQKRALRGLHVWPQLVEQASKVCAGWGPVCRGSPTRLAEYSARRDSRQLARLPPIPRRGRSAVQVEPARPLARHKFYNYLNAMPAACATARPRCRVAPFGHRPEPFRAFAIERT